MTQNEKAQLASLRTRLVEAQTSLLLSAAGGSALPSTNELRRIADIESVIGAIEALLDMNSGK